MILSTLSSPPSPSSINIISSCDDDDDSDTIAVDYCCCSPNHLQAQRFNNIAVTCIIEHGQQSKNYEKAISILEKALQICEKEKDQEDVHEHFYDVCSCHSCSIDNLITVSSKCESDNDNNMHDDNNNDGTTIYQNPIYVQEGHNMGPTLTHIIAFNLALVHHLRFVLANNKDAIEISINKALQCYELAYECNLSDTCSIRFDEMICNNLSHINRFQEQTEEERHFQQQQQQQQQETTLEQEKETLHHLQEPISVSDDEDDNDDDVSNSSLGDTDDLLELDYYSHEVEQEEEYEQERKQRKRKHTHKLLTTTPRQRNKLQHVVVDDLDHQYSTVIDTCSVSHKYSSHGSGEERDTNHGEDDYTELCQQRQ